MIMMWHIGILSILMFWYVETTVHEYIFKVIDYEHVFENEKNSNVCIIKIYFSKTVDDTSLHDTWIS